jgi:dihydropteroate synthase
MNEWFARGRSLLPDARPRIMGILNVTPDSFSDGGLSDSLGSALARGLELVGEGADIIDVGGESSRPGATPVSPDEELRRVMPVVEALASSIEQPISIDTWKALVVRKCLEAGASIVNDITALGDPEMAEVVAEYDAAVVLMHMQGTPQTMQVAPQYDDVVAEVVDFLARRIEQAEAAGISRDRIAIDPGIGFGKRTEHNLLLLRNLERFASLGRPLLIGTSRKGLLGKITGRGPGELATASVASALAAIARGARVVRVHDVGPMADAIAVWEAQVGWDAR